MQRVTARATRARRHRLGLKLLAIADRLATSAGIPRAWNHTPVGIRDEAGIEQTVPRRVDRLDFPRRSVTSSTWTASPSIFRRSSRAPDAHAR